MRNMDHANEAGEPKIPPQGALPLTGKGCVDLTVTDLCVMACDKPVPRHVELAPGAAFSLDAATGPVA